MRLRRQCAEQVGQRFDLGLGVIAQHMAGHPVLMPRMADAQPHAAKVRPQMLVNRAQAVMPRRTAAGLHLDAEGRDVEFVVKDGQGVHAQLVEAQRLADAAAAFVHEGGGLQQQDLLTADPPFLGPALELLLHGAEVVHLGNGVHRHEADIVAVHRILRARIAQPGPDLHVVFLVRDRDGP